MSEKPIEIDSPISTIAPAFMSPFSFRSFGWKWMEEKSKLDYEHDHYQYGSEDSLANECER